MTTQQAITEMMAAWIVIEAAAREQYPAASAEAIYQIAKAAMNKALALS